jgi:hypothetical protein
MRRAYGILFLQGMALSDVERWLAPNLAYEPEPVSTSR